MGKESEYAKAGVDYTKAEILRRAMIEVGKRTIRFPNRRDVFVEEETIGTHGVAFEYRGEHRYLTCETQEGLGNKNWVAELMYKKTGKSFYENIGIDTALSSVNDVIAQGGLPVIFLDEIAANSYDWGADELRSGDLAEGYYQVCKMCGMALPAGESSALRYLVEAKQPVNSAPVLSGCATAIIAPKERLITGKRLQSGDRIIGVSSSGIHVNGISLVIERALTLKDGFLHELPNGRTLGEEVLIPTRSYVALVEALLGTEVDIHAIVPGTGSGVSKIAFDKRPFTYRIRAWPEEKPAIFSFMRKIGVSPKGCLTTFNEGIGYYIFVPEEEVKQTIDVGEKAGYELFLLGEVEKGKRGVIFEPENILLPPPGE